MYDVYIMSCEYTVNENNNGTSKIRDFFFAEYAIAFCAQFIFLTQIWFDECN